MTNEEHHEDPTTVAESISAAGAQRTYESVLAALNERWRDQDAAAGWTNDSDTPHPTGGYTTRQVRGAQEIWGQVVVDFWAPGPWGDLVRHRTDGPTRVFHHVHAEVVTWEYLDVDDVRHREDGPAFGGTGRASHYALREYPFVFSVTTMHPGCFLAVDHRALARVADAGAPPTSLVRWVMVEAALSSYPFADYLLRARIAADPSARHADAELALISSGRAFDMHPDAVARWPRQSDEDLGL